jgi:methanethiol S-methyltransferase
MEKLVLGVLWSLYFAIHSVLAMPAVKAWVQHKRPSFFRSYRVAYNFVAVVGFAGMLAYQRTVQDHIIVVMPLWVFILSAFLMMVGVTLLVAALKNYDLREFIGLSPMEENQSAGKLRVSGLNALVRHPLYLATILILLGYLAYRFTWNNLIFVTIALAYIEIGSRIEEKKLVRLYGEKYTEYQKKVKRLLLF